MSIRLNFIQWLISKPAVNQSRVKTRVWPLKRPGGENDELPCLVVNKRGAGHTEDVTGTTDHRDHSFRLTIIAETYEEADEIFERLAGKRDPVKEWGILSGYGGLSMNGQDVSEVSVENDFDGTDLEYLFGNEVSYMISIDVKVTTKGGS